MQTRSTRRPTWRSARYILPFLLTALAIPAPGAAAQSQASVLVEVWQERDARGHVLVALCTPQTFLTRSCPYHAAAPAVAGTVAVRIDGVPPGIYSIEAFHDDTDTKTLERSFFGLPPRAWASAATHPCDSGHPASTMLPSGSQRPMPPSPSPCTIIDVRSSTVAGTMLLPPPMVMASPRPSPDRPDLAPTVWDVIDRVAATSRGAGWSRSGVRVSIVGVCPTQCRAAFLRVVDELATNAAEHAVVEQQPGRLLLGL